jgi:hypothetical protein
MAPVQAKADSDLLAHVPIEFLGQPIVFYTA